MNKKNLGIKITCGIFGVLLLCFAFLAIVTSFKVGFALDLEYAISNKFEWGKFSLVFVSLVGMFISCLVIIAVLVVSDDKVSKQLNKRERKNSFQ